MGSFDRYSNKVDNAPFDSVVFGSEKTILEVELNEMQQIQNQKMEALLKASGDCVMDCNGFSYDGTTLTVNTKIVKDGIIINTTGSTLVLAEGESAYITSSVDTKTYADTINANGNTAGTSIINTIKDDRGTNETSRRKVLSFTLNKTSGMLLGTVIGGKFVCLATDFFSGIQRHNGTSISAKSKSGGVRVERIIGNTVKSNNVLHTSGESGCLDMSTLTWTLSGISVYATKPSDVKASGLGYAENYSVRITADKIYLDNCSATSPSGLLAYEVADGQTPSQYAEVITEHGKNLLNSILQTTTKDGVTCTNNGDGTYTLNGTDTSTSYSDFALGTLYTNGNTCKIIGFESVNDNYYIQVYSNSWSVDVKEGVNIPSTTDELYVRLIVKKGAIFNNVIFKPMITTDLSATYSDFVSYEGHTAIITLSSPLAKGDFIDGEKEYHACNVVNLKDLIITRSNTGTDGKYRWYFAMSTKKPKTVSSNSQVATWVVANRLNNESKDNTWNLVEGITPTDDGFLVYIDECKTKTQAEMQTWLQSNPIIVCYELATHTYEPLTDEQVKALHSLKSYEEETHIDTVDTAKATLDVLYSNTNIGALALENYNHNHSAVNSCYATDGTIVSSNADYAEVGEWSDGNTSAEDRIGYFVSVDNTEAGITMVKATSTSDVRGVTIKNPAFSANAGADRYENGHLKKQYNYVGFSGFVPVIDNGTCTINKRCVASDDGTAIPSNNDFGYQVIDRIDDTHILILVEPQGDAIQRIETEITNIKADGTVNLLNPTLETTTQNGVTCTNNGDGTFTLNGTASANTNFIIQSVNYIKKGIYKLLGCPMGGSVSSYMLYFSKANGQSFEDYGNGKIVELSEDFTDNNRYYVIFIQNGTECDNLVFKPMLTTNLNATYEDFVPYTGSTGKLNSDVAEVVARTKVVISADAPSDTSVLWVVKE